MEDHIARLDWPRERIDRYRDHRLRMLLGYARERSPFHARRLAGPRSARRHGGGSGRGAHHDEGRSAGLLGRHRHRPRTEPRARRTCSGTTGMVFVHARRLSGVQFGWLQRRSGRLRLGLAVLRVRRVSGLAHAGTGGAERATAGSDTAGRAGGGRAPACQHATVRRADRCGHGDRRHRGRSAVRRGAGGGGGRPTHAPRRLPVGDRPTSPRRAGRRFATAARCG